MWRTSWKRAEVSLHRCILARRSTSLISSGSQNCRLKVVRYRSLNCWMTSTLRLTTPYHVATSIRSASSPDNVVTHVAESHPTVFQLRSSFRLSFSPIFVKCRLPCQKKTDYLINHATIFDEMTSHLHNGPELSNLSVSCCFCCCYSSSLLCQ